MSLAVCQLSELVQSCVLVAKVIFEDQLFLKDTQAELAAPPPRYHLQLAAWLPGSNVRCNEAASLCNRGQGPGCGARDSLLPLVPLVTGTSALVLLILPSLS